MAANMFDLVQALGSKRFPSQSFAKQDPYSLECGLLFSVVGYQ
jgi:hypothetical protein